MMLPILFAAIELAGVVGQELDVRAYFDANNVLVGDPLVLNIDFVGEADFESLHPPVLSKAVGDGDWKIDDASAKTDTYSDARRLTYRVRPMREGVLWFPELEFAYRDADGGELIVKSNAIPVHAKPGMQIEVEEVGEDLVKLPDPGELLTMPSVKLSKSEEFEWRKALAHPTADGFAGFDFPEAAMNEARCAILEGQWQRALSIYSRLEWRIGQTEAIERGIVAALARRYDSPAVELPMWRQVLRPVLRYSLVMRVLITFGAMIAAALLFMLVSRIVRRLAALAFVLLLAVPSSAEADLFEQMDKMFEQQHQMMQRMMNSSMSMSINGEGVETPQVIVRAKASTDDIRVGQPFEFLLEIESPADVTLDQMQIRPSEMYGMTVLGNTENLGDVRNDDQSNVVRRLSIPVRYDVPFKGELAFAIDGMATGRRDSGSGRRAFSFSFSNSFHAESRPFALEAKPLEADGQPADFCGLISERAKLVESLDMRSVGTNDVIQITYRLDFAGYIPKRIRPEGVAFEIGRTRGGDGGSISWRRYFVADGTERTPEISMSYYDPVAKKYRTLKAGGTDVSYR